MQVTVTPFWLPKAGHSRQEYEDAFFPDELTQDVRDEFHCAVADGATETSFSGFWAKILSAAYGRGRLPSDSLVDWELVLDELQADWWQSAYRESLPWYAEEKLQAGAFAALAGLSISGEGKRWSAVAVGDSCLFHTRGNSLLHSFPLAHAVEFGSRPYLLSSRHDRNVLLKEHRRHHEGNWQVGDRFYLMTDALACWVLSEHERTGNPWSVLSNICSETDIRFAEWVDQLRASRQMRNDDVTLLCVDLA